MQESRHEDVKRYSVLMSEEIYDRVCSRGQSFDVMSSYNAGIEKEIREADPLPNRSICAPRANSSCRTADDSLLQKAIAPPYSTRSIGFVQTQYSTAPSMMTLTQAHKTGSARMIAAYSSTNTANTNNGAIMHFKLLSCALLVLLASSSSALPPPFLASVAAREAQAERRLCVGDECYSPRDKVYEL